MENIKPICSFLFVREVEYRSMASTVSKFLWLCWQLKERESLLPLLQLSTLEDEGRELAGSEPPLDTQLAQQEMKQGRM